MSHQCIDGEVVIIHLETGSYYSLLDSAAELWQGIAAGMSRDELSSPATAEDVHRFVDELIAEGLISDEPSPARAAVMPPNKFTSPPRIEKFTDMQELLALDPIHEVDAAGWPHRPADS